MSDVTYTTFDVIGQAEDVSDKITNINPKETPFYSNGQKKKATATLHQWQTQELQAATENRAVQGADAVAASAVPTTQLTNYTGIAQKTYKTSGTADVVKKYGRDKEHAYQTMLKGYELRRDVEVTLLANAAKDAGSSASAAVVAGLPTWLTNVDTTSGTAAAGTGADTYTAGSTLRAPAIDMYFDAHQLAYEDGGDPDILMMSPTQKRKFSALTLGSSVSDTADVRYMVQKNAPATAIGAVDVLLSDFGTVDCVINRQMTSDFNKSLAYFLDTSHYGVAELRPFQTERLAKTGDNMKSQILCEFTLEVDAPKAHSFVADLAIT